MGDDDDNRLAEPDPTPWAVHEGRLRAQRGQSDGLKWRMYLISDVCLHAVNLKESCDLCVVDLEHLKENA